MNLNLDHLKLSLISILLLMVTTYVFSSEKNITYMQILQDPNNLDLNLDLFKAFLTLSDLVFPPFIISKSSKLLILAFFIVLMTTVIFLNLSSLRKSIL